MSKKPEKKTAPKQVVYPELHAAIETIDAERAQVFLDNNHSNRPRSGTLVKRYAIEMLRQKWKLNGEAWIVSKTGQTLSAQHRAAGVILAEQMRKRDLEHWKQYGTKGPIKIQAVVVYGVDDKVADTIDQGKTRSAGDVIFRMNLFDDYMMADKVTPEFKEADKKKLSRDLSTALRTVWLRIGGMKVSDAPKFPQSEMLDFFMDHPRILDCVLTVYREDDGANKNVSSLVSRAYLAAVMYLGATAGTDREAWDDGKIDAPDFQFWDDAVEFVQKFAYATNLQKGDAVLVLRSLFQKQISEGTRNRDHILSALIKAMSYFMDKTGDLKMSDLMVKKDESWLPSWTPRLGGLDQEIEVPEEEEVPAEEVEEKPAKKPAKKKTAKKASAKPAKKASRKSAKADPEPEIDESDSDDGDYSDEDDSDSDE